MLLRKLINLFVPLRDFLYILQLEEYEHSRYLAQVQARLLKRGFEKRARLQYTGRMQLTYGFAVLVLLMMVSGLFLLPISPYASVAVALAVTPFLTPFVILVVSLLVAVPVQIQKRRVLRRAASYFKQQYPDTKVIAITGSFGKTTVKYMLQHVLQYDYKTAIIPDNINTGIGIASYILRQKIPQNTEILIVEMGAYRRGDIAESTAVVSPNFSVLTILGDQHLERFGSYDNLVHGKAEIYTSAPNAICYTTTDAAEILTKHNIDTTRVTAVAAPKTPAAISSLVTALTLELGVNESSLTASLQSFTPPGRRNNIIKRDGVTIVDNSYNISPMAAEAMIKQGAETAKSAGKQLVVMTAGIGEQGIDAPRVNQEFGELLNKYATRVIIHPSIYLPDILKTLTVPYVCTDMGLTVSEHPADWLDGETEMLLWLTDHSDASYL